MISGASSSGVRNGSGTSNLGFGGTELDPLSWPTRIGSALDWNYRTGRTPTRCWVRTGFG